MNPVSATIFTARCWTRRGKQGIGRLIRDFNDRGVIMLADPRLTSREYARQIFASLPSMPKTRDEQTVLTFIHELKNELPCD